MTELRDRIQQEVTEQPHLAAIRGYNHTMIGELNKMFPLAGKDLLDVGASIHGYALEAALDLGVALYEGIDLDVRRHWGAPVVEFQGDSSQQARLREMNAEELQFSDESFDAMISLSTFEHFLNPSNVLKEMHRVLRPAGVLLVSFEPIWTGARGHHLHHFGAISDFVPPWAHLLLGEGQMRELLGRHAWPTDAPIGLDEALQWIYHGSGINRFDLREIESFFRESPLEVKWIHPMREPDEDRLRPVARYVSRLVPYDEEELLTRGFSALLVKGGKE